MKKNPTHKINEQFEEMVKDLEDSMNEQFEEMVKDLD